MEDGKRKKLTDSGRKKANISSSRQYRARQRLIGGNIKLPISIINRWKTKALQLRKSNAELAKTLLDLHDSRSAPSPSPHPHPLAISTPCDPKAHMQGYTSGASEASAISGVAPLQSPDLTGKSFIDLEKHSTSKQYSDDELDISVNYKISGQFVYPQELESDIALEDDDFWEPVISCRKGKSCEGLDVISQGEEVHCQGYSGNEEETPVSENTDVSFSRSGLHRVICDPTGSENTALFVITETRLRDLAQEARSSCTRCSQPLQVGVVASGSSAHITWTCENGHKTHFCCQETLQRSHLGDLKIAAAIELSGNNFTKVALLAKFSKLAFLHGNTFNMLQQKYVSCAVEEEAADMFAEVRKKHKGKPLVVLGDGRNDSPGHCAQYLTYTFMEDATKDILHMEVRDKRQTALVSTRMEVDALLKGLDFLMHREDLTVTEMVTDAHTTITSRMRQEHPAIKHSYDVWHGAKNLGKKLSKVSTAAANRPLGYWQSHVTNHFWHCSKSCGGSAELFKQKWRGVLHHTTGRHEWVLGGGVGIAKCEHDDALPARDEYLKAGSPAHLALANIAMDEKFLKNIPFYVNFRHTGELESIHNHILMYASKRFAFGFVSYRVRNLLAMIDYQCHKDRPVRKDSEGNDKYIARWSKSCKDYVAIKDKVPKEYAYIPALMLKILRLRLEDMRPLSEPHVRRDDDPRRIAPRLATKTPTKVEEILKRRHMSRF